MEYKLLDSGDEQKLEQFGQITLIRPSPSAIWRPHHKKLWEKADATFTREEGWKEKKRLPHEWVVTHQGFSFKLKRTDFGHVGLFPEHAGLWNYFEPYLKGARVLNLFAYSGAATLFCAKHGASVVHLDASKGMVDWARENAVLNGLETAPIRWIVDDAFKFLNREIKREQRYDGFILDPPSFGRGKTGEVFKIETHLHELVDKALLLFSEKPRFFALSCHTPGFTPLALKQFLEEKMKGGHVMAGEMILPGECAIPSGIYAVWLSK
jgi:23S rRNA (cytosine1962-C5)-methyltransferase